MALFSIVHILSILCTLIYHECKLSNMKLLLAQPAYEYWLGYQEVNHRKEQDLTRSYETSKKHFTFVAFVQIRQKSCTASILSPFWLLTATICYDNDEEDDDFIGWVYAGNNQFGDECDFFKDTVQMATIAEQVVYPSVVGIVNTVMLLRLNTKLQLNEHVSCIPIVDNPNHFLWIAEECYTISYAGKKNSRMLTPYMIQPYEICNVITNFTIESRTLCSHGITLCPGVAGSPLICQDSITGVASHVLWNSISEFKESNNRCGKNNSIVLHEFIGYYGEWIEGHVHNAQRAPWEPIGYKDGAGPLTSLWLIPVTLCLIYNSLD